MNPLLKPARFLLLVSTLLYLTPPVDAEKISITSEGVVIDAGVAGQFTILPPSLMMKPDDYEGQKPAWTVSTANEAEADYPSGAQMKIQVSGSKISFAFSGVPKEAHAFRVTMMIPIKFSEGGQFSLDEAAAVSFPAHAEKQQLFVGHGAKLRLKDPSGEAFSITTTTGFHEIGDYRVFNWPIFAYIFNYVFREHEGEATFNFDVQSSTVTGGAPNFLIDKFGQFAGKQFPGKIMREEELKEDVAREQAYLDSLPQAPRDTYGGLAGTGERYQLKKTNYFRVDQTAGRHVLVTPEGNIFYQLSVCSIRPEESMTVVRGREKIFEWLPPKEGNFASAWFHEDPGVMSFYVANCIRKHGAPFDREEWSARAVARLRKWGFNSAGAWSDLNKTLKAQRFSGTPQLPLEPWMAKGLPKMQGAERTYDPFTPGVEKIIDQAFAEQIAPHAGDPTILGYFVENEVLYENIAKAVPAQKSDSPAKRRLVQLLGQKYRGDVGKFKAAWGLQEPIRNFSELNDAVLFVTTSAAAVDMQEFMQLFLETHFSLVARLFRKHDPNHLLLGCRWQPGTANNERLVRIAAKYMDVVSVNYYVYAADMLFLKRIHEWSGGKPLLLSEWHYTSADQGLRGQKEVRSQKERGLAYRNYVESTAVLPFIIGHQWFTYTDQPATGRWFEGFNGEAGNTGLVNVADRPYLDFVHECKKTNDDIYKIILGEKAPFRMADPRFAAQ